MSAYLMVICASDSRGGAGLQAALAQAALVSDTHGVTECRTVLTACTAQSHKGVEFSVPMPVSVVESQIDAALNDGRPGAILIGWLPPEQELLEYLLRRIRDFDCPIIWDPVVTPTLGEFYDTGAVRQQLRALIVHASVMTPSLAEARWLIGDEHIDATAAARQLQALGAHTVMITGGDSGETDDFWVTDIVVSRANHDEPETLVLPEFALHQRRLSASAHGGGSHLSAALAVALFHNERLYDAIVLAAVAARQAISAGTINLKYTDHYANCRAAGLPDDISDWPLISAPGEQPSAQSNPVNPATGMGLYALTDSLSHLKSLLALGVDTIQWRVKAPGREYRQQTIEAITLCSAAGVPFWLNDDWQLALDLVHDLAIESAALTGVHLGQEDLLTADLDALGNAGLRFGVSTHTEWEIARARALKPGYIAFGPVYSPLSKTLRYPPLGVKRLRDWVSRFSQSELKLTCIGGITPANAKAVAATGIGSLAVVTSLHPGGYNGLSQQENAKALHQALENNQVTPITGITTVTDDTTGTEYSIG